MESVQPHPERDKIIASFILPFIFVLALWVITLLDQSLNLQLWHYGVLPRTALGLKGILFYPLIHADFGHIASNTLPLLILGALAMYFYRTIAVKIFIIIYFISGLLIWVIARQEYHIGASGIIYGLSGFLITSGIIRRNNNLLAISLLIIFLYSGMMAGMFPTLPNISWEGHLSGFFVGMFCAFIFRKQGPPDEHHQLEDEDDIDYTLPMYGDEEGLWERPNYYQEEDEE